MAGLDHEDGDVTAKRILLPVERTTEMEFALRVTRMIALESGGVVRLLAVIPIPQPVYNRPGYVVLPIDQQIDRRALPGPLEQRPRGPGGPGGGPGGTGGVFAARPPGIGPGAASAPAE